MHVDSSVNSIPILFYSLLLFALGVMQFSDLRVLYPLISSLMYPWGLRYIVMLYRECKSCTLRTHTSIYIFYIYALSRADYCNYRDLRFI